jgi:hypothetical protein
MCVCVIMRAFFFLVKNFFPEVAFDAFWWTTCERRERKKGKKGKKREKYEFSFSVLVFRARCKSLRISWKVAQEWTHLST